MHNVIFPNCQNCFDGFVLNWAIRDPKATKSKQGNELTRTFEPTNECADCWSATNSYDFNIRIRVK